MAGIEGSIVQVIGPVVDPAQAERRPGLVAFAGMVIDDVQDHFDSGAVERLDHLFELSYLAAVVASARKASVRREIVHGAVAPVVVQPAIHQRRVVKRVVDWQEFDRCNAKTREIRQRRGMR